MQATTEHRSKIDEKVSFTIRKLNVIQRAQRDSKILTERAEYLAAVQNRQALTARIMGSASTDEERRSAWDAADPDLVARVNAYYDKEQVVFNATIMPETIRASLVRVSGLAGIETSEALISDADDDLINEVYALCAEASGLTVDQQKN